MEQEKKFSRGIKVTEKKYHYKNNLQNPPKSKMDKLKDAGAKAMNMYKMADLFGKPINLKYNGNDNFTSVIGATITLSTIAGILLFFISSLILFLQRKGPSYSSVVNVQTHPDPVELSNFTDQFDWTIGFDIFSGGDSGSIFDPRLFSHNMTLIQTEDGAQRKDSRPYEAIPKKCSDSEAFNQPAPKTTAINEFMDIDNMTYYQYYRMTRNQMETARCFLLNKFNDTSKPSEDQVMDTSFEGSSHDQNEKFIQIVISPCKNTTEKNDCYSLAEQKEKMNLYKFRYYFTQQVFKMNDSLQNPIQNSTSFFVFPIQKFFSKTYNLYIQKNKVFDSWNILSTTMETRNLFSYSTQDVSLDFVSTGISLEIPYLTLNIKIDTMNLTFSRKFVNIKDFFIAIVGICNGIFAGGAGFGKFVNSMLLKVDLINKSFYLIEDDNPGGLKTNASTNKNPAKPDFEEDDAEKKSIKNIELADIKNDQISLNKTNRPFMAKDIALHPVNNSLEASKKKERRNSFNFDDHSDILDQKEEKLEDKEDNKAQGKQEENPVTLLTMDQNVLANRGANIVNSYYNDQTLMLPAKRKQFQKFKMAFGELIFQLLPCCKSNKKLMVKKKILEQCGTIIETFFDIERIIGILREYQDLRNVVLSSEEYKILKQLTTPIVEIVDDEIKIKKAEKIAVNEKELKKNYNQFVQAINKMIKMPYLTPVENNLLEIHRLSINMKEEDDKKSEKSKI